MNGLNDVFERNVPCVVFEPGPLTVPGPGTKIMPTSGDVPCPREAGGMEGIASASTSGHLYTDVPTSSP